MVFWKIPTRIYGSRRTMGLVMYDRERNTFKNFDSNDGLKNNEFADGAAFQSANSMKLLFGGIDGLDIVYPHKLHSNNYFPKLMLTDFLVHNVPVTPGDDTGILDEHIDRTDTITLNYDQNFISFSFTTLDYWNKQKSAYALFPGKLRQRLESYWAATVNNPHQHPSGPI